MLIMAEVMKIEIVTVFFLFAYVSAIPHGRTELSKFVPLDDEDAYLTVPQIIAKNGYPVEEHTVNTSDGYILTLHRIPHGRNSNQVSNKVVFLQHGLLCSSADWIITGIDNGLGYILADEGYDVWMGNARGNTLSRNHTTLDPKSAEFWQFSWHEIGAIDLPAMIDYALEVTGQTKLHHIGHSQGTTTFYVMTSMRPEYNAKIKSHYSLAPVAYMNHLTSPLLRFIALFSGPLEGLFELIGINEFLPNSEFLHKVADLLCDDDAFTQVLCSNALFALCGFDPKEMNATILPVLTGHTPAGSSTKQLVHYGQEIVSGAFRQYDFGLENLDKYGSLQPPDYDLDAITAPIYLFYSYNDWMASTIDVVKLCDHLGPETCKGKFLISENAFNHLDYLFAIHARELVYNKLISLMARH